MYSDIFCRVYNEFGWNYYPEIFAQQLLLWMEQQNVHAKSCMDLGCGTGVLCRILKDNGIDAEGMDLSEGMIAIARENDPAGQYTVADMIRFCPDRQYDLVTCTGDALNHIPGLESLQAIFRNVYAYTAPGGYFLFDLLKESEISDSEPFESDFTETTRVWFRMTRPDAGTVNLQIRVFENDRIAVEENIRETLHDPAMICRMLTDAGFTVRKCADTLPDLPDSHGTTWFVVAQKNN